MNSIGRLHIPTISETDWKRAGRISDRLSDGKRVPQADEAFYWDHEAELRRLHGERERLKREGWDEFRSTAASVEARANGLEKVIYSHWHRAVGSIDTPASMTPETYAGHWLHSQRNQEWFDDEDGKAIFALLCSRYPIPREPLLKEGYTYVWLTPSKPRRGTVKRGTTKTGSAKQ